MLDFVIPQTLTTQIFASRLAIPATKELAGAQARVARAEGMMARLRTGDNHTRPVGAEEGIDLDGPDPYALFMATA